MIDWEGLLKFSLQYSDGTNKSAFKEMSQEDKKWLEEAIKSYSHSDIERIKTILDELAKPEEGGSQAQKQQQQRLYILQQLQELLDSLDKGSTLFRMNGHIILLKIIFFSKYDSNRIVALQIFSSINQNDAHIQTESINSGALQLVETILKENNIKIRQSMTGAISAMVRGQNLEAKRIFIKIKGLDVLKTLFEAKQPNSKRLKSKIFVLLRDLLFYDDKLHQTYNDLSQFSNTASIDLKAQENRQQKKENSEKQSSLTYDKNKEVKSNFLEQNKHFKGYIKNWIKDQNDINNQYNEWLKQQEKLQQQ